MTTRKALIEKIQSMQLGTQEMLDAAKDDSTLIPFDTLFVDADGGVRWRVPSQIGLNNADSVAFGGFDDEWRFFYATQLHPMPEE